MVANPDFESWVGCSVGSRTVYSLKITSHGRTWMEQLDKTLTARDDTQLQVETIQSRYEPSTKERFEREPEVADFPSEIPAPEPSRGKRKEAGGTIKSLGKQSLKIGGQKYLCTIYQVDGVRPLGSKFREKKWMCDEVPGRLVRSQTTDEGCAGPVYRDTTLVSIVQK